MKKISLCIALILISLILFVAVPIVMAAIDASHNVNIEVTNGVNIAVGNDVTLSLQVAEAPGDPIPAATASSDISYSAIKIGPTNRAITLEVDIAGDSVPVGMILSVAASAPVGSGEMGTEQGTLSMVNTTVNAGTLITGIGTCWATAALEYEVEITDLNETFVPVTTVVLKYTMIDL